MYARGVRKPQSCLNDRIYRFVCRLNILTLIEQEGRINRLTVSLNMKQSEKKSTDRRKYHFWNDLKLFRHVVLKTTILKFVYIKVHFSVQLLVIFKPDIFSQEIYMYVYV